MSRRSRSQAARAVGPSEQPSPEPAVAPLASGPAETVAEAPREPVYPCPCGLVFAGADGHERRREHRNRWDH